MTEREQLEEAKKALEAKRGVLGDAVVDASIAALQKQLDELEPADEPVDQYRKFVTILYTDIVGSTAMGKHLELEENTEVIEPALQRFTLQIEKHGGRVARYEGDGFKAVFGDPVTRERDAEMAVFAGLKILAAAQEYAEELEAEWGIQGFNVRVGVNTGWVARGGKSEGGDTLRGMTVNLAKRVESAAPKGGLLISNNTYRQVKGIFEVEPAGRIEAKGFEDPVDVYLVVGVRPPAFRLQTRGVDDVETPMLGRDMELKHIKDACYAASEDNELQVVTVLGEAGIGKSRLLYEFQDWLDESFGNVRQFQGRCQQGMSNTPYALLRTVFSWQFKIQDSDSITQVKDKLETGFGEIFGVDEAGKMRTHIIAQLLGFDFSQSSYLIGVLEDPQQLRDRALVYLGEYFQSLAELITVAVLLEDIHWADDSSLDTINHLALNHPTQRILIICVGRKVLLERRQHWGEGQDCHSRLTLKPLSKRESRQLVGEILKKVEDVPLYLREMIVDGAEGNPYYIEELVKMLVENGVILKGEQRWEIERSKLADLDVPATLTGVLQARLDSLPAEECDILQQASVVGRVFWDDAIQYINKVLPGVNQGPPLPIDQILMSIHKRGLIYQRETSAFAGMVEYTYKNTIMQEVIYQGVLKKVRQAYHGLVAEWLSERIGERTGEFMGMMAEHMALSGQVPQAAKYLRKAGEQAARQYANQDALDYLGRALELTAENNYQERYHILIIRVKIFSLLGERQAQETDLSSLAQLVEVLGDDQKRGEVALLQAFHARETSNYPVIIEKAQEAIQMGQASEVPRLVARGNLLWGRALLSKGDHNMAGERFEAALTLARSEGLSQIEADCLRHLGIVIERSGDRAGAVECFEQALEIYRNIGDRRGEGRALHRLGNILLSSGEMSKTMEYYHQFLQICQEIGDRWGTGVVIRDIGDAYLSRSDLREASAHLEEALEIARQYGNVTIESDALVGLGIVSLERGEFENAKILFEKSLRVARAIGNKQSEGKTLLHIGRFFHRQGDYFRTRSYYEQALQIFQEVGYRSSQGQVEAYFGLLAHHLMDDEAAKEYCQKALEKVLNHQQHQAFALMTLGHACRGLGLSDEATDAYQESLKIRNESEQRNLAIESQTGLAGIFLDRGSLNLAVAQVDEILHHLETNTLEGTEDPSKVYLTCFQVLKAVQDPRAQEILSVAYDQLQSQAGKIEDEELRHSFLQNVPANREIVSEFEIFSL